MATHKAIVLYSSTPSSVTVENAQRALFDLLSGKQVSVATVDGAVADNKEKRSELWAISGKRAVYPQLFIQSGSVYEFVGDWDEVTSLVESDDITHAFSNLIARLEKKS